MIQPDFDSYLKSLCDTPLSEHTEHTGRTALENLLNAVAVSANGNITVQQEPKRVAEKGAPDFKVYQPGMILGYVETKPVGENLDRVLKSDQLKKIQEPVRQYSSDRLSPFHLDQQGRYATRNTVPLQRTSKVRGSGCREDRASAVAGLLNGFFFLAP